MKFKQIRISGTLEPAFGSNLRSKWGLVKYQDPNAPSIFFGLYSSDDITAFLSHKGRVMVVWGGGDQTIDKFKMVMNHPKFVGSPVYRPPMRSQFKSIGYPYRNMILPLKSFDKFKPINLGNKIYVYKGWKRDRKDYFKWGSVVEPLMDHFGEDRFIYTQGANIDELHDLYKQCFIYVKPNEKGGATTMWELGHMGIRTICNNQGKLPNTLEYKNLNDIISLIEREESRIGSVQRYLANLTKSSMMTSPEWLNLKYWKKI